MMRSSMIRLLSVSCAAGAMTLVVGCRDRVSMIPNSDPALRQTKTWFAEDAKTRFPYPTTRATKDLDGAVADVDVQADTVQISNFSQAGWHDIDVWLNGSYVVHVPLVEPVTGTRTLNFQMIYNERNEAFPTDNDTYPVTKVEIEKDGMLYNVAMHLAY